MISGAARQTFLKLSEHSGHGPKDTVGKLLFAEFVPAVFLRIAFRRLRWQTREADVFRPHEGLGHVGTGAIDDHEPELLGMSRADLRQKLAPPLGVHLWAEQPVQFPFPRADGSLDLGELALVTLVHHGPDRGRGPATAEAHQPAKARSVLEHQPHPPTPDRFRFQQGCQRFREFFFQSACAAGRLVG